ncbi:MAG: 50S ribosomal protein L6 [Gammaproteobacteria bacterium]|nr:50S ribosomal protein L6 [Gammaproteobacteria bacterium]
MSRVAKNPINVPSGVQLTISGRDVTVKGSKGSLSLQVNSAVSVEQEGQVVRVKPRENSKQAWAQAGTARALLNNMITGVSNGFERKLDITGVGYRAQVQGKKLNLTLGFSHPVELEIPAGITIETPSQTEIFIRGMDKQAVGQVAAVIRAYRPPEPYKGKGVRYSDETILRKEAKKS